MSPHRALLWLTVFAVFGLLYSSGNAQEVANVDSLRPGSSVVVLVEIPLRDSPARQGFLYQRGSELRILRKGERLEVTGERRVTTLFDTQQWIQLQDGRGDRGWAYSGQPGKRSCCFGLTE